MKFKIGFTAEKEVEKKAPKTETKAPEEAPARESLVRVYFPQRGFDCTYYNNLFDLHVGDLVYVDGKLEGKRGKVIDVSYTFKIKLSDYKRVIAKIDTDISGEFCYVGDELFSFDKSTVPFGKILPYFKAPAKPDEEYASAKENKFYNLDDLEGMGAYEHTIMVGKSDFNCGEVLYLSVEDGKGHAIVGTNELREVEFDYKNGMIANITCDCWACSICKHGVAAVFALKSVLEKVEKHFPEKFEASGYFAVMSKNTFMDVIASLGDDSVGSFVIKKN